MTQSDILRLDQAKANQASYKPSPEVVHRMQDVTFVALIGISGIGKSHLIPYIVKQGGKDFSEVGNISTRAPRPSDPPSFRGGKSYEELLDRIERRDLVNYVIHPSGDIYATDIGSYQTPFVLLPTLTSALPQLEALGCFKQIIPIGLGTDGATWEERFKNKQGDPKLASRLDEALACINWLKTHASTVPILVNQTGEEVKTAQKIVALIRGEYPRLPNPSAAALLEDLEGSVKKWQGQR